MCPVSAGDGRVRRRRERRGKAGGQGRGGKVECVLTRISFKFTRKGLTESGNHLPVLQASCVQRQGTITKHLLYFSLQTLRSKVHHCRPCLPRLPCLLPFSILILGWGTTRLDVTYTDEVSLLEIFPHHQLILDRSPPLHERE